MGMYQLLREAGYEESPKGPVVISGLTEIIEGLVASFEVSRTPFARIPFAILPGFFVPEARPDNYDPDTFKDNYVVFQKKSD